MPHYTDEDGFPIYRDGGTEYLELHDNRTMWDLTREDDYVGEFHDEVSMALEQFELETGVEIGLLGRSARHVCVANNYENRENFAFLQARAKEIERELVHRWNTQIGLFGFEWPRNEF